MKRGTEKAIPARIYKPRSIAAPCSLKVEITARGPGVGGTIKCVI